MYLDFALFYLPAYLYPTLKFVDHHCIEMSYTVLLYRMVQNTNIVKLSVPVKVCVSALH